MFRVFKSHMKDVWNERQEMRSTVLLDGYDHEQRLDDEDWQKEKLIVLEKEKCSYCGFRS